MDHKKKKLYALKRIYKTSPNVGLGVCDIALCNISNMSTFFLLFLNYFALYCTLEKIDRKEIVKAHNGCENETIELSGWDMNNQKIPMHF